MTLRLALPSRMKIYPELSASTSARLLSAKWTSLLTFNSHVKTELLDRSNATAKPKFTKEVNNQAEEFTDFMPFNDPIKFNHQETEKLIKVLLINDAED